MGEVKREVPSPVDDDYTRAFIDGWNARLDRDDFDMALHFWMLSQVTHIGTRPTSPDTGLREAAFAEGIAVERARTIRWLRWYANANAEARDEYAPGKSSPQHSVDLRARADSCRMHAIWLSLGKHEGDEKPDVIPYTDALSEARAALAASPGVEGSDNG